MVFELLDTRRRSVDELLGVQKFNRRRSIHSTPRGGGSVDIQLEQDLNLLDMAVRAWVELELDGEIERWPAATFLPQITGQSRFSSGSRLSFNLLDYTSLLDTPIGRHYAVARGSLVTPLVRALLLDVGVTDAAITESSGVTSVDMYYPPTETRRKVINELLKSIGYSAVWADPLGQLRCEPYLRPSARPVQDDLGFIHGQTCTYYPQFDIEHDISKVPNHAVIVVRTVEPLEPVVCHYWLPDEHPHSVASRGGLEVPYTETDVEIAVNNLPEDFPEGATQAQIDSYLATLTAEGLKYAQRRIEERLMPTRSYQVTNRWRPIELNTVTRFFSPAVPHADEIDTRVSIIADEMTYDAGKTIKASSTLQEVVE